MLSAVVILAAVAGLLAIIGLVPAWREYPTLAVSVLLLAIAVFLLGHGVSCFQDRKSVV